MSNPVTIRNLELEKARNLLTSPDGEEYAAVRIVELLAEHPEQPTVQVNQICSIGNISHVVNTHINPHIVKIGLYVACSRPPKPLINKFNQKTGQWLWSLYRLPEVANDAVFDEAGE